MTAVIDATETKRALADGLLHFLATGEVRDGLFADDVFGDISLPTWRIQSRTRDELVNVRLAEHPGPSTIVSSRFDATPTGFVLEMAEHWWDEPGRENEWYARELFRADIGPNGISQLSVYCTGDWDTARRAEHAAAVTLIRP
jgi:hypothetical protein